MTILKTNKPTESELEILQVLWDKGNATVRTVHEELSKTKDSGYTTTLKLMQIMFEKGLVSRDDSNKTHIYQPVVTRIKTQGQFLNKMINTLFAGSSAELVMQALGNHTASADELKKIEALIADLKNKH
ncbi:MAG: BlaI/MecI/CopY family transcriptional regulator [Ferruginibacter sp.]